jgi:energy-coupling factor transport system substrate-specific component
MADETSTAPKINYVDTSIGFFPLVLALICGVATGVLWAYANPIQLVPGVIQWRIFAFLPPLIGLLLGPKSGFITGYVGTIVWSLLAGTFIPAHSLLVDGIMVGLTGFVPPYIVNLRKNDFDTSMPVLIKVAVTSLVVGIVMVAAVSASLAYLGIFPFDYAMLYIGLSDIVPMVVGTPLLLIPGLRILAGISRGSLHWF